ncbi:GntR family transcriptional regulator [Solicola gregarius]|uniref:GntR family transcriptional regulator n=1 Tax=Solicola gregarius TaxID=2908642 RepID=A0AA46YLD1_9ACTN|nr:GntR family transcriptional regulator [Solicola gregarius]UYM05396.1 GntR family transcriptional regulator [Solicola gregarius]
MANEPRITLDRSSPVPLYFQVAEQLEAAIVGGTLAPGDRISNEVSLAHDLGLSRPTMRQAIQVLVDKGMLVRKRGVGTQVVHGKIRRSVELTSLYDDLSAAGQGPRTEVLSVEITVTTEEIAHELQVEPGEPAWSLVRLRYIGDEPLALMHNFLPAETLDLNAVDLENHGLYEALRRTGLHMRVAQQRIGARRAEAREARLLGEKRGAPLLTMRRTAYDDAGLVVEYGTHVYRPELYSFEITLVDR